jgi:signal recognition particle receptor subunit beta
MVAINYANREVSCKIVYYGPGLSGKTTNLQYIHGKVPGTTRGDLISLATDADRTLYFDFLPINIGDINGFTTRFQLYTVPGQVFYNATRKLVLRGVDGLIFVADSQRDKADENVESLNNLKENLSEYGYDLGKLPLILQYNKRDLPDIMSVEELDQLLNDHKWPVFESVAHKGKGVFDTLKLIIKMILEKAKKSGTAQKIEDGKKQENPPPEPSPGLPPGVVAVGSQETTGASRSAPAKEPVVVKSPLPQTEPVASKPAEPEATHLAARAETGGSVAAVAERAPMMETVTGRESSPEADMQEYNEVESEALPKAVESVPDEESPVPMEFEENEVQEGPLMEQTSEPEDVSQTDNIDQSIARNMEEETPDVIPAAETPEDDAGDDPFALPSARPKMAAPTKAKQKKKKGFFLFRWLSGRK